jgi:biopolymer transport protein ExbB
MSPFPSRLRLLECLLALWFAVLASQAHAATWWNKEWTIRKKITVDAADTITEPLASATVLLRLHDGNFSFGSAKDDGSDLRFVADDDKTLLPFHIEKIDPLLNEAFVWVKVSDLKPGAPRTFWLYYGNANAASAADAKASFDADTVAIYHFAEHGSAPADSTSNANNALAAGVATDGTIIGTGLRLDGRTVVKLPASASLKWNAGAPLTWSAWMKLAALPPKGVLFSRREGANAFVIGVDSGVPFVEITTADGMQRTPAGEPLAAGAWRHIAVVATAEKITLFLDGESYATLAAALPALNSEASVGGEAAEGAAENTAHPAALTGELDELQISKIARPASALKFAAVSQGTSDKAAKLIAIGNDEESAHAAEGEIAKHLSLISDISKSLTVDGWAVIFLCSILALVGGVVTVVKFLYLSKITKATKAFLKQWANLSADLSSLDHGDLQSVKSLGGTATGKTQRAMRHSPLYHLYQLGFAEIQHRVVNARDGFRGLSGRSMEAIKATLDGGLVREVQRLNSQLVFLTIGIAGGPYLGLLGTVIGVMITFAVIAKSGAVEVNSIAPGIAGALLATVAGLAVAIPALFAYSYISTRIKDAVSEMQIFIDEFVAKIAEAYPEID